jgi:hypothetical protein
MADRPLAGKQRVEILVVQAAAYTRFLQSEEYQEARAYQTADFAPAYCENGRIQEALQLTEGVVTVNKRTLGDEDPKALLSMNNPRP